MISIKELIFRQCPLGVKYVPLRNVCSILRGNRVTKKELKETGKYPVISGGMTPMGFLDLCNRKANSITVSQYGTAGYISWQTQEFWANDICYTFSLNEQIIERYLYHVLIYKQKEIDKMVNRDAVPFHLPKNKLESLEIPVPPLEIQEEVVRILDKFTDLKADLETELEGRKQQYEYYKRKVFSTFMNSPTVEKKEINNVCDINRGVRVVKQQLSENKGFPVYQNSLKPLGFYDKINYTSNHTFVICGGAAGKVGYSKVDFWAADDCFVLVCSESLNDRYLYHALTYNQQYLDRNVRKAGVPRLSRTAIEKLEIPIPSITEQIQISAMLDKFYTLINDEEKGIPAEIELLQQQYEYYRDKLLTFKRAN